MLHGYKFPIKFFHDMLVVELQFYLMYITSSDDTHTPIFSGIGSFNS